MSDTKIIKEDPNQMLTQDLEKAANIVKSDTKQVYEKLKDRIYFMKVVEIILMIIDILLFFVTMFFVIYYETIWWFALKSYGILNIFSVISPIMVIAAVILLEESNLGSTYFPTFFVYGALVVMVITWFALNFNILGSLCLDMQYMVFLDANIIGKHGDHIWVFVMILMIK